MGSPVFSLELPWAVRKFSGLLFIALIVFSCNVYPVAGEENEDEEQEFYLTYKYSPGDSLIYDIKGTVEVNVRMAEDVQDTVNVNLDMKLIQRVRDIEKDGAYIIDVEPVYARITRNDETGTIGGAEVPFTFSMKPDGEVVQEPGSDIGVKSTQLVFPPKKVRTGMKWSHRQSRTQPVPIETEIIYKLRDVRVVDGFRCAIIEAISTEKGEDKKQKIKMKSTTKAEIYFDIRNGRIVRVRSSSDMEMDSPLDEFQADFIARTVSKSTVEMSLVKK